MAVKKAGKSKPAKKVKKTKPVKEVKKEKTDEIVRKDKVETAALLNPGAYWGQRLRGALVSTTDGDIPCTFTVDAPIPPEEFPKLVLSAKTKIKYGKPINSSELYALMRSRADLADPGKRGPLKSTVNLIRQVATLSVKEGVEKYGDIAVKLGVSPAVVSAAINRYPDVYSQAISDVLKTMSAEDKAVNSVIAMRAMRGLRQAALKAPAVVDELMTDYDQPGGVRLKAADTALKAFGIGEKGAEEARTINLSVDKVAIVHQTLKDAGIPAVDAEEVQFEEVQTEGSGDSGARLEAGACGVGEDVEQDL